MAGDPLQLYFLLVAAVATVIWLCLLLPPLARSSSAGSALLPLSALYLVGLSRLILVATDPTFEHADSDFSSSLHDRVSQLTYLASFALIAAALMGTLTNRGRTPRTWVVCLIAFGLVGSLSALVNGDGLDFRSLVFPGLVFVIARGRNMKLGTVSKHLRYIVRMTTFGSLAFLALSPNSAQMNVQGRSMFGIEQVAGLSVHPNALGATAALGLAVELTQPRSRWWPLWVLGDAACLVLAQSRGGWMAALAVALVLTAAKLGRTRTIFLAVVLALAMWWILLSEPVITTGLNGRGTVWRVAFDVFLHNPLLGGGPNALLREVEAGRLLAFAAQAHNQVLDALAKRGLIGASLAIGFFVSAIRRADQTARLGALAPLASVVVLLTGSLVETVLAQTIVCMGCAALLTAVVEVATNDNVAVPSLTANAD